MARQIYIASWAKDGTEPKWSASVDNIDAVFEFVGRLPKDEIGQIHIPPGMASREELRRLESLGAAPF
jgi:hypothetical protein